MISWVRFKRNSQKIMKKKELNWSKKGCIQLFCSILLCWFCPIRSNLEHLISFSDEKEMRTEDRNRTRRSHFLHKSSPSKQTITGTNRRMCVCVCRITVFFKLPPHLRDSSSFCSKFVSWYPPVGQETLPVFGMGVMSWRRKSASCSLGYCSNMSLSTWKVAAYYQEKGSFKEVKSLFYSRKNFMLQLLPGSC